MKNLIPLAGKFIRHCNSCTPKREINGIYMVYFIVLNDASIPWRERVIYVGQEMYELLRASVKFADHEHYLKELLNRQVSTSNTTYGKYRLIEHEMLQYKCGISFYYYEDIGYPPHIVENAVQSVYRTTFGQNHLINCSKGKVSNVADIHVILNSRKKVAAFVNVFINKAMLSKESIASCREFSTGAEYNLQDDDVISVLSHDWDNVIAKTSINSANEKIRKSKPKYYELKIDRQQNKLGWKLHQKLQKIYAKEYENKLTQFMLYFMVRRSDNSISWQHPIMYVGKHLYGKDQQPKFVRLWEHTRDIFNVLSRKSKPAKRDELNTNC